MGNDWSVIDNDHDLAFIRDVNDVVVQMSEVFRFAEWESSLDEAFTMYGNEEIHMILIIFLAILGDKHEVSKKLELDGIAVNHLNIDFSFKKIVRS